MVLIFLRKKVYPINSLFLWTIRKLKLPYLLIIIVFILYFFYFLSESVMSQPKEKETIQLTSNSTIFDCGKINVEKFCEEADVLIKKTEKIYDELNVDNWKGESELDKIISGNVSVLVEFLEAMKSPPEYLRENPNDLFNNFVVYINLAYINLELEFFYVATVRFSPKDEEKVASLCKEWEKLHSKFLGHMLSLTIEADKLIKREKKKLEKGK